MSLLLLCWCHIPSAPSCAVCVQGETAAGIDVRKGAVSNMLDGKVVQPLLVSTSALTLATECVRMILKVRLAAHSYIGDASYPVCV